MASPKLLEEYPKVVKALDLRLMSKNRTTPKQPELQDKWEVIKNLPGVNTTSLNQFPCKIFHTPKNTLCSIYSDNTRVEIGLYGTITVTPGHLPSDVTFAYIIYSNGNIDVKDRTGLRPHKSY